MPRRLILTASKVKALCEAWHGPHTLKQIAKRFKVKAATISKCWQAARIDGRLPAHPAERPHFLTAPAPAPVDLDAAEVEPIDADDDAPIGGPLGLAIPRGDPLLRALRLHHADIDFAEAHIAPELLRAAKAAAKQDGVRA